MGRQLVLLIDADPHGDLVRGLWPGIAAGDLPAVMTMLMAQGVVALPSFALAQSRPDGLLVLARGAVAAFVYNGAELAETVRAGEVTTWREVTVPGADRTVLTMDGPSTSDTALPGTALPLTAGVVAATHLDWTPTPTPTTTTTFPAATGAAAVMPAAPAIPAATATDAAIPAARAAAPAIRPAPASAAAIPAATTATTTFPATAAAAVGSQTDNATGTSPLGDSLLAALPLTGVPLAELSMTGVPAGGERPALGEVMGRGAVTREWKEPTVMRQPGELMDRLSFLDGSREDKGSAETGNAENNSAGNNWVGNNSAESGSANDSRAPVPRERHFGDTVSARRGRFAAVRCPKLHLNPPATPVCRECLLPLDPAQEPFYIAQPLVGHLLRLDSAERWPLAKKVTMLGRAPSATGLQPGDDLQLVPLRGVSEAIREVHAEVRLDGWRIEVVDRSERGDTLITNPGDGPVRLEPGVPMRLLPDGQLKLAGEVTLVFGL